MNGNGRLLKYSRFFSESSRVKIVGVGEGIKDLKDVSKIEICYHIY